MKTGILIVQLGTPDAPETAPLRRYLRQFLSDKRVVDFPDWLWQPILQIILLVRPSRSAEKYRRIWDPVTGSPLMHYTKRQTELLKRRFPDLVLEFGMQIGNPPLADVLAEMIRKGVERLLVLPMYPQYSVTTTASAYDSLFKACLKENRVPAIRVVPPYFNHDAYIQAITGIMREDLAKLSWEPDHFLISFHGIPKRYCQQYKDPYATHVKSTTWRIVREMGWSKPKWTQSFQSLFGREVWLKPYTDDVLVELAKKGVKKVYAITPGFTADCLETVDEIAHESLEVFREAGGEELHLCPGLNDHTLWIDAMERILREEGTGWLPEHSQSLGASQGATPKSEASLIPGPA